MICTEMKPLLGRFAERELKRDEHAAVEGHLDHCEACRWTVTLLEREEAALGAALRGERTMQAASRSARRLVTAATVALVLLGGSLFALHRAYRQLETEAVDAATKSVLIRARSMPLDEFVSLLSETSGVTIALDVTVRERPRIDLELVEPIRLASVLAILKDFHGLRSRIERDRVVIY